MLFSYFLFHLAFHGC